MRKEVVLVDRDRDNRYVRNINERLERRIVLEYVDFVDDRDDTLLATAESIDECARRRSHLFEVRSELGIAHDTVENIRFR